MVCFIDGDGCIFSFKEIARGWLGGQEIARRLAAGIQQRLGSKRCQIHARVFCNLQGVRYALEKYGEPQAAAHLTSFVHGFNQSHGRFMMVDVGPGKELADHKIRGNFLSSLNCLGCNRMQHRWTGGRAEIFREDAGLFRG